MMMTIPFVLYGLFRYTDSIYNRSMGGEPELIFRDPVMLIVITMWVLTIFIVLLRIPETILSFINTA